MCMAEDMVDDGKSDVNVYEGVVVVVDKKGTSVILGVLCDLERFCSRIRSA